MAIMPAVFGPCPQCGGSHVPHCGQPVPPVRNGYDAIGVATLKELKATRAKCERLRAEIKALQAPLHEDAHRRLARERDAYRKALSFIVHDQGKTVDPVAVARRALEER